VYGQLMLDKLSETLGISSESLDQLLASSPPERGSRFEPPETKMAQQPDARSRATQQPAGLNRIRKSASLKAIELLLRNPEIALTLQADLEPLRYAGDESQKLLLTLIEKIRKDPSTETYHLLGYCYGTSLGGQLTQLLQAEKITPQEGVEAEFTQMLDNILSNISQKLHLSKLKDELKSRVSEAPGSNPDNV
ncbi:MAG: hypothetical protein VXZ69_01930, partial [Pseudomonadota bacterium]|nr:hypothetical protein [Pseudomonadota bacterium]